MAHNDPWSQFSGVSFRHGILNFSARSEKSRHCTNFHKEKQIHKINAVLMPNRVYSLNVNTEFFF